MTETRTDAHGVAKSEERIVNEQLDKLLTTFPPDRREPQTFLGAQFDAGLAFVHFPTGYGGLGLSRKLQATIAARLRLAGAPETTISNPIGYGMAAPTIVAIGSAAQKDRYLRPLFTCEEIWCQLFSEPGAGSDIAGLATRAERDGDQWVVNGQKVWTSFAHLARFGLLLARTDPQAEKHQGLSYFVVDMHAKGVEVRPLRQMSGDCQFNEVYFTDVPVLDSERLGGRGQGWKGALVTLMNERVAIGGAIAPRGSGTIAAAVDIWRRMAPERRSPVHRDRLARLWTEAETLRLTNMRATAAAALGTPGPEGSIGKLAYAELNKRIFEFCIELLGPEGMLYDNYEASPIRGNEYRNPKHINAVKWHFLRSRANSIEGGTTEVMKNILGERVLGLPPDIRVDKDVPWSQLSRARTDAT